jgi:HSF-type DNA-binding
MTHTFSYNGKTQEGCTSEGYATSSASPTMMAAPRIGLLPKTTCCGIPTFPFRLHDMLNDAERKKFDHVVSWQNPQSFKIHDRKVFEKYVLPRYFQTRFKSFQRQRKSNALGHSCFLRRPAEVSSLNSYSFFSPYSRHVWLCTRNRWTNKGFVRTRLFGPGPTKFVSFNGSHQSQKQVLVGTTVSTVSYSPTSE